MYEHMRDKNKKSQKKNGKNFFFRKARNTLKKQKLARSTIKK